MEWFQELTGETLTRYCTDEVLIVLGDAVSKHEWLDVVMRDNPTASLMSVNNGAEGMDVVTDYWCGLHCDSGRLMSKYPLSTLRDDGLVIGWACRGDEHERVDYAVNGDPLYGTGALLAVLSGLWLGYGRIILVGCDLLRSTGYGNDSVFGAWSQWAQWFGGRVEAVSGSLVDIIGGYDEEDGNGI